MEAVVLEFFGRCYKIAITNSLLDYKEYSLWAAENLHDPDIRTSNFGDVVPSNRFEQFENYENNQRGDLFSKAGSNFKLIGELVLIKRFNLNLIECSLYEEPVGCSFEV